MAVAHGEQMLEQLARLLGVPERVQRVDVPEGAHGERGRGATHLVGAVAQHEVAARAASRSSSTMVEAKRGSPTLEEAHVVQQQQARVRDVVLLASSPPITLLKRRRPLLQAPSST